MRVWHDWEFLEDGVTIKPISVGMVREDGAELYRVFTDAPWYEIGQHEWLSANVVPHLDATRFNVADRNTIRYDVEQFLLDAVTKSDKPLELWGWYSAYDHVCLAQLFGRMIDLPSWCPQLTKDLRQEFERAGCAGSPYAPKQLDGNHNALADAKHMKVKHEWFERVGWAQHVHGANKGIQIGNGNTQSNKF